ncbi:MAG: immune inhibitor A, partial [Actinomycetota bacterium]|nr:immune inhibitor A [Actinomycetota bacterium]
TAPLTTPTPATFRLQVRSADGRVRPVAGAFATGPDGSFAATLPGAATAGLVAGPETDYRTTVAVEVVDVETGERSAQRAGAAAVTFAAAPGGLQLHNSYVSPTGWVKPGQTYPFRVFARNFTAVPSGPATVTIPAVDGATFVAALASAGQASVGPDGAVTWAFDGVPAATDAGPGVVTLVVEGRADTLAEDPQVVWKNLSSLATLAAADGQTAQSASHGPKVIPQDDVFDTARYGDRPFPVVPVDYFDRKHEPSHPGSALADKINSPAVAGSTFNLYQEMSYGQLYPQGDVPSAGIATAGWDYPPGFAFTEPRPQGTCIGTTFKDQAGSELYPERIRDGWYQLPGTTGYYGADRYGSALPGALTGIGLLFDIDNACGPAAKAVYDAAQIADPELDYSDFDTDKDGVVDFFMMVFVGLGGNGASQTQGTPPYDNVWPHSSSLEFTYVDPDSGLRGYVSDDQLRDHQGRPLFYTDAARAQMTTEQTAFPVFVRVGPYNVNPETSIEHASVISHEYGHSLGLPDFYSLGDRQTYGDWNLMATDKSQHMDVFGKQELGWVVPRLLAPGDSVVTGWVDSKANTGRIDWVDPAGRPYTLQGPGVANGQAYMAKLPPRQIIDPAVVAEQASGTHLWWSRSGNAFGCPPDGGHNLDIVLPELAELPAGSPVRVQFRSRWDIEWDFDYGFVMVSTDGGRSYRSLPSANGYSTPQGQNPNTIACQAQYGNGITGSSGSYAAGSQEVDRLLGEYPEPVFVDDAYDLTAAAGSAAVLRFSYATDVGLARPGWFVDDLRITAGDRVIYETDFETAGGPDDPRVFNGGCKDQLRVAARCTGGWLHVDAGGGSPADHAYYLELRDRSGFDFDGHGENDRDPIGFEPGLLLVYSDEAHGYGNVGTDDPPAQSPLDAVPEPGSNAPNLNDAAFKPAQGRSRYSDASPGHVDNYRDPRRPPNEQGFGPWLFDFNCLSFEVLAMTGDDVGPATAPGDLTADVAFTTGPGCARFDYGLAGQDIVGPADAVERVAGSDRIQT